MTKTDPPPLARFSVKPFSELRVIEIAGSTAGAYAAKFFADHGATVVKVEPPGGDPLRRVGPEVAGSGSLFAYTNTGKRSLVLDVRGNDRDSERVTALARGADLLIESSSPAPLMPLSLQEDLPRLVRLYVSPFGLDGPYAGYSSSDFTDFAIAGHMYINGDPDRPPLQGPRHQSEYCSGIHAFIGAMAALWARERTGLGQAVDVSHFEVMASIDQYLVTMWTHSQHIERRVGNATPGPWHPNTHVRCQDGSLSITAGGRAHREAMVSIMGLDHLWDDPRFADPAALLDHRGRVLRGHRPVVPGQQDRGRRRAVPGGPRARRARFAACATCSTTSRSAGAGSGQCRTGRAASAIRAEPSSSRITQPSSRWRRCSATLTRRSWRGSSLGPSRTSRRRGCPKARSAESGSSTSERAGPGRCAGESSATSAPIS